MNHTKIREKAKEKVNGKRIEFLKPTFVVMGIACLVSMIVQIFTENENIIDTMETITTIALLPATFSITLYELNFVRGKKYDVKDIFNHYDLFGKMLFTYGLVLVFTLLFTLCFIVPGIIFAIAMSLVLYLFWDKPEFDANEYIDKSKELMNGYKMDYVKMNLYYILLEILGLFTFGIFSFYILPEHKAANILYYEELLKVKKDK